MIIGGNGHGSVIAALYKKIIRKTDTMKILEICGFVNDFVDNVDEYAVLGGTDRIQHLSMKGIILYGEYI